MRNEHRPYQPNLDNVLVLSPEVRTHRVPVIIAPGLGSDAVANRLPGERLKEQGFFVVCPNYDFGLVNEPKKFRLFPWANKVEQLTLAGLIEKYGVSNEHGVKQVDVVTHSKGFHDILKVALANPGAVRNIIAVAPATLLPRTDPIRAIGRLTRSNELDARQKADLANTTKDPKVLERLRANEESATKYKQTHRWHRRIEALTSAMGSTRKETRELIANGVKIVIVAQDEDAFYPSDSFDFLHEVVEIVYLPGMHGQMKFTEEVGDTIAQLLARQDNPEAEVA